MLIGLLTIVLKVLVTAVVRISSSLTFSLKPCLNIVASAVLLKPVNVDIS
jgi:hypothetical protein